MLAVFERIDLSLLETILAAAAGERRCRWCRSPTSPRPGRSAPDARISARFTYWLEVRTARNALGADQLAEQIEPETVYGSWLALAEPGSVLHFGVIGDSEQDARERFSESGAKWQAIFQVDREEVANVG